MRVDLHCHARPGSRDAYDDVAAIAAACAASGADAFALTDHGPGCDYGAAARIASDAGLTLIPGRELNTPLGHVLALTTDTEWLTSVPESCALPPPPGCRGPLALVWAHPAGWRVAGALVPPEPSFGGEHVHAIEVLNGERLWQQGGVRMAEQLAAELGAGTTGGSDAHRASSAGRCLTVVEGASDAAGLVEGVRSGVSRPMLNEAWARANAVVYSRPDLAPYTDAERPL